MKFKLFIACLFVLAARDPVRTQITPLAHELHDVPIGNTETLKPAARGSFLERLIPTRPPQMWAFRQPNPHTRRARIPTDRTHRRSASNSLGDYL
jgi:hypothetical protein